MNKYLDTLINKYGWHILGNSTALLNVIEKRYVHIPLDYLSFIDAFSVIENQRQDVWFLTRDDYAGLGNSEFRWNEFEIMSLDCALTDAHKNEIHIFWNMYLPISISVCNGYSYLAINVLNNSVVIGHEPEFEECEKIADDFHALISDIFCCLSGEGQNIELSKYLGI